MERQPDLVDTFKQQHAELLQMAARLSAEGRTDKDSALLARFKRLLLRHLEQEDHHFYPKLFEAAKGNPRLMRAARVFTWDVEQVTAIIKEMLSDLPDGAQTQPLDPAQVRWMLGKLRRQVLRGKDPEEISQTVLAFFKDNPALWLDPTDFEGMLEVMRDRIDREETILFPIYEELTDGQ